MPAQPVYFSNALDRRLSRRTKFLTKRPYWRRSTGIAAVGYFFSEIRLPMQLSLGRLLPITYRAHAGRVTASPIIVVAINHNGG